MMLNDAEECQLSGPIGELVPFTSGDVISSSCSRPTRSTTTRSARTAASGSNLRAGRLVTEH
jgi:hypothetical protein